jgi:hypothetical protein
MRIITPTISQPWRERIAARSVCTASDIKGLSAEARKALEANDAGWSAVRLEFPQQQRKLIILNQTHSLRQQSSDLTHELSHHLCGHRPFSLEVSEEGLLMLETYSRKDEEEADWLSGRNVSTTLRHELRGV